MEARVARAARAVLMAARAKAALGWAAVAARAPATTAKVSVAARAAAMAAARARAAAASEEAAAPDLAAAPEPAAAAGRALAMGPQVERTVAPRLVGRAVEATAPVGRAAAVAGCRDKVVGAEGTVAWAGRAGKGAARAARMAPLPSGSLERRRRCRKRRGCRQRTPRARM